MIYIELAIPRIQYQLHHVANGIITGIHDAFTPDKDYKEDVISLKKILKKEAAWAIIKNVMGFEFYGNPGEHTIWITEDRCTNILTKLKSGLGKESIEKGYPLWIISNLSCKIVICVHYYPRSKRTIIPVQPGVGKISKTYLLASKQTLIVGYLWLSPPTRTFDKKYNSVQGNSHGMATLYMSKGCI